VEKLIKVFCVMILLFSMNFMFSIKANAATMVMWGKTELKVGQIGKVTILSDINLVKLQSNGSLSTVRSLKKGEEYRVYSYKTNYGGLYGVGGGSFVQKKSNIKYETPSKSKLALLNSKVLTTPEIAKKTESKIVTMHLKTANNEWVATGIVIGDGYILVNTYAIDGVTSGRVITSDNRSFELQGAAFANVSLAIMKTKIPMGISGIPLQPSVKTLVKNERIVTVEMEEGKSGLYVTEGTFDSSFYFEDLLYNSTHDEASITMPGGAVMNARGYLIGLQTKGFRSPVNGARVSIASDEIIKVFQPFRGKKFSEVPATFYSSPF